MAWGVDPAIVEAKTGLRTQSVIGAGLEIAQVYYNLLEALKTQKPKIVVVETYPFIMRNSINDPVNSELLLDVFGVEPLKRYKSFLRKNFAMERRGGDLYDRFYIFRYHEDWTDVGQLTTSLISLEDTLSRKDLQVMQRSSYFIPESQVTDFQKKKFSFDDMYINEQEKRFLLKLMELSIENDFELVFFTVPVFDAYYEKTRPGFEKVSAQLNEIISENNRTSYFDLNGTIGGLDYTYLKNEWGISHSQHLNYKGVIKTSNDLSNHLTATFKFKKNLKNLPKTAELAAYNTNIFEDSLLEGGISRIHFFRSNALQKKDTLKIPNNLRFINIEGWMHRRGMKADASEKILALKKGDSFLFVSAEEMQDRAAPDLVKQFGKDYKNAGYTFRVDRRNLEKGVYKIYHILRSEKRGIFLKDMKKWILLE
jgi:hypothetical protein